MSDPDPELAVSGDPIRSSGPPRTASPPEGSA